MAAARNFGFTIAKYAGLEPEGIALAVQTLDLVYHCRVLLAKLHDLAAVHQVTYEVDVTEAADFTVAAFISIH